MTSTAFKTDKYEITMLQSALEDDTANKKSVFELFARKLPTGRRYGIVGGTERAIEAVKNFRFTKKQIAYLAKDPIIKQGTLEYLKNFKFSGNIYGYAEGDIYFPYSPVLTVEATFGEAVLLETVLLSILNHDSAIASASSRMTVAGEGLTMIEMGSRRTHDDSAVSAARMAFITGFDATSNLECAIKYGVPSTGTSAHAFSLAHIDEKEAFARQIDALGVGTTLLVDTYDIEQGIRNAIEVAGTNLGGIRIDSGDLNEETVKARILLDELGALKTKIVLSSDIDEVSIRILRDLNAPVDAVGVGTRLVTGSGAPTASMVYKLVSIETEIEGKMTMRSVAKKASGKKSIGGMKAAWRVLDTEGKIAGEFFESVHTLEIADTEVSPELLAEFGISNAVPVKVPTQVSLIINGKRATKLSTQKARKFHARAITTLPENAKLIEAGTAAFEAHPVV